MRPSHHIIVHHDLNFLVISCDERSLIFHHLTSLLGWQRRNPQMSQNFSEIYQYISTYIPFVAYISTYKYIYLGEKGDIFRLLRIYHSTSRVEGLGIGLIFYLGPRIILWIVSDSSPQKLPKSCPQHGQQRVCWSLGPSSKSPKFCTFPTGYCGTQTFYVHFYVQREGKGGSAGCLVRGALRRVPGSGQLEGGG